VLLYKTNFRETFPRHLIDIVLTHKAAASNQSGELVLMDPAEGDFRPWFADNSWLATGGLNT